MAVERAEELIERGETCILDGKYEEAIAIFERLLEQDPDNVEALNDLAIAASNQRDSKRAFEALVRAVQVDPSWEIAWENLEGLLQGGAVSPEVLETTSATLNEGAVTQAQRIVLGMMGHRHPEISAYRAAFAQCDITPADCEKGIKVQGFGKQHLADRVATPLQLQMLLLEDAQHHKLLIVTADLFGFAPRFVQQVRTMIRPWGIPPEAVVLNASHTHYAPGTTKQILPELGSFYQGYAEQIGGAIQQLLVQLHDGLEPCFLYKGKQEVQIGMNRRYRENGTVHMKMNPSGYYHASTPLLAVDLLTSGSSLVLVNHGCHPTGSGLPDKVTAGYPGHVRNALVQNGRADHVMFLQGAAGDVKPTSANADRLQFASSPEDARANGEMLAREVAAALNEPLQPVRGPIYARIEQVELPLQEHPSQETLAQLQGETEEAWGQLRGVWAQRLSETDPDGWPTSISVELQLIGMGPDTCMLTLPGEPVSELARHLIDHTDLPEDTFLLGYTNGLASYLPTEAMVDEGGYEVEGSHMVYMLPSALDRSVEARIQNGVNRLLQQWKAHDEPNGYGRYHLMEATGPAFFCLSTGRCGTKTLSHVLNTATNARVYHHPRPYLIEETLAAYHHEIDTADTFWEARRHVMQDAWKDGLIFGETDHNMTPFAPAIAETIDDAKFVGLVRNPWDFVRSGMRRQYYQGHPWDKGRLRPASTHPDAEKWVDWTPFEKVCWLWNATYEHIADALDPLPEECYRVVQFEELVDSSEETRKLFDFLDLEGFDSEAIEHALERPMNQQQRGHFPVPDEWDERQHRQLWNHCHRAVDRLGLDAYRTMRKQYEDKPTASASAPASPRSSNENEAASSSSSSTSQPARIQTTTIWDYKKFKYQAYPEHITPDLIAKENAPVRLLDRSTPITSMGSCFARNVATYLLREGYNYLITEQPPEQASAHWDQVFNTACMRQIFEYSLTDDWNPIVRWWPKGDKVQDPFRRDIIYPADARETHFERHRTASREALTQADVVILTLGLIETWRDKRDHATFYRVPSPSIYDPDIHEFHVQTLEDCQRDLDRIHALLAEHNPDANLVVTVSPVPLFATFRMDVDVVTANMLSKSTLRVAAEYFAQKYDNVHYFPSYEIVRDAVDDPYEEDNRHVPDETVATVMRVFEELYAGANGDTRRGMTSQADLADESR